MPPVTIPTGRRARRRGARRGGLLGGALLLVAVVAAVLLRSGEDYELHARFANAGQLVRGGLVQVAGKTIGTIQAVTLTPDGQADVRFRITDDRYDPLREGTRISIRAVGQATLTNRYLDVGPGPDSAPALPNGAVVPATQTAGIVDLDQILNAVDPEMRRRIQGLVGRSAEVYAGTGAKRFNAMLRELDPAVGRIDALVGDLSRDRDEIERLIASAGKAAGAVGERSQALAAAIDGTSRTMAAVAAERGALGAALDRAPATLRQMRGTMASVAATATDLRPTLRLVPGPQPGLRALLRQVPTTLGASQGPIRQLSGLLPAVQRGLEALPRLEGDATAALRSTAKGLDDSQHILEGLRFYGSDLILGVINGLTGISSGQYNQFGKYLKLEFLQSPQTFLGGVAAPLVPNLTGALGLLPGVMNTATNQRNRCPGSNAPPAPDGSNPWYPKEGICDPTQSMSRLVNSPTAICRTQNDCVGDRRSLAPEPEPSDAARRAGSDR
ncbi:MlaD family protein [Patulibacter brassicae]|uniref:MlaD family protein n=1 Tax=Patulibacter brassicae TaxID=1705717 RepID=A0ABU4VQN5_9ACTN|nr:MlaD family protein [Patulibacter brassicae]MDX8153780.1 MlaD family protein [Patulibacter brassicae]